MARNVVIPKSLDTIKGLWNNQFTEEILRFKRIHYDTKNNPVLTSKKRSGPTVEGELENVVGAATKMPKLGSPTKARKGQDADDSDEGNRHNNRRTSKRQWQGH